MDRKILSLSLYRKFRLRLLLLALSFVLGLLALPFATRETTSPLAEEEGHLKIFPQVAVNLKVRDKLRTTVANRGTRPATVEVFAFDLNGTQVKHDVLHVGPGAMQFSDVSCVSGLRNPRPGACPGLPGAAQAPDGSTPILTEVACPRESIMHLWVTTAVVSDADGTVGPGYIGRLAANHNETLVRDAAPEQ